MLTPCDRIRREILLWAREDKGLVKELGEAFLGPLDTPEQIDAAYDLLVEADADREYEEEFRTSGEETNIPREYSRHYEARSVATQLSDGVWVGWCQWYGGGKHGEPGAVPWMEDAYELTCVEEEKVVRVRTFTKRE